MNSFSTSALVRCCFTRMLREHHLLERALFLGGLMAQLLHQPVRLDAPELVGERERHRLGHDLSAARVEIGAHPVDVDLEAFGDLGDGLQRARGDERERPG